EAGRCPAVRPPHRAGPQVRRGREARPRVKTVGLEDSTHPTKLMPDVVTFGEAMVRLAPPHFQRLEQARALDVEIGGAELNAAVGLARLGRSAAWVSRLPDNPLGHLVANRVREAGVGDAFVQFAPDGRCGLYFLEFGDAPRASSILYDRKDSSVSRVAPGVFDWPTIFAGARWFHVTGITAALSAAAAETVAEAMRAARAA